MVVLLYHSLSSNSYQLVHQINLCNYKKFNSLPVMMVTASGWVLELLDQIYMFLVAKGERRNLHILAPKANIQLPYPDVMVTTLVEFCDLRFLLEDNMGYENWNWLHTHTQWGVHGSTRLDFSVKPPPNLAADFLFETLYHSFKLLLHHLLAYL
ncbi:uncharacterized protein LOC114300130 [Camellia sinensis]|uniref:uncharacterized protein LOC114300130 n=1 Tax=Camellia sinensis TaxID=4442 RepID=UPI0010364898|nr:uncharacterized protein LOC114300130 [Camellia sinensis]